MEGSSEGVQIVLLDEHAMPTFQIGDFVSREARMGRDLALQKSHLFAQHSHSRAVDSGA
jgi:hypothetical protein